MVLRRNASPLRGADANDRNPNYKANQRGQGPVYLGVWLEPGFQMRAGPVDKEDGFLEVVERDAYSEEDGCQLVGRGEHGKGG